jgi:hypothetical protein
VRPLIVVLISALIAGLQVTAYAQKAKPEIRFPGEDQSREGTVSQGPAESPWSAPSPLDHPPADVGVVRAGRDDIADELNRAELNRLLHRGPRGATFR